jgi:hypothetical protein
MKEQINRKHQVVAWLDDYPYSRHVILDVSLVAQAPRNGIIFNSSHDDRSAYCLGSLRTTVDILFSFELRDRHVLCEFAQVSNCLACQQE